MLDCDVTSVNDHVTPQRVCEEYSSAVADSTVDRDYWLIGDHYQNVKMAAILKLTTMQCNGCHFELNYNLMADILKQTTM